MPNQATVTVVIVNWNGGEFLNICLQHLLNQSCKPDRILVMDNGSSDQSAIAAESLPGVTVAYLRENLGFATANNRALALCDTDWVCLLNPDAFVEKDWLEQLLLASKNYPEFAVFGSRQLVYQAENILDGIGDVYHASGLVWRHRHGARQTGHDLLAREIFSPCAAAAMYSRVAISAAGGFDEDFFCYVEDVDLGFRLRLLGYKARYVPEAVVHHVGSASTGGQSSDFSVYHGHRNLVWTFVKNMPGWLFWVLLPWHMLLNGVTVVYFGLQGRGSVLCRAKRDALCGLGGMWRKRRAIQQRRNISIKAIWTVLDKWPVNLSDNSKLL